MAIAEAPPNLIQALPAANFATADAGKNAAPAAGTENFEAQSDAGRKLFDNGGGGLWTGLMGWLAGKPAEKPLQAPPIKTIESLGSQVLINGLPAKRLGFGSFKDVFLHPQDDGFVVKIFNDVSSRHSSLDEKRLETANIRSLEPLGATPRLAGEGALAYKGRTAGFIVTERVRGFDLRVMNPEKHRRVAKLFADLTRAGLEIADSDRPMKLRQNIMVGSIAGTPDRAYLVDADLSVSKKNARELRAFYAGILSSLN